MKQGTLINRIVVLVLFGALMLYLSVSAWKGLSDRTITTVSYSYTLDEVQEATGFLVREEYVLPERSSLAEVLPAEGEKVAGGQTVAYLYQSAQSLERKRELRSLTLQREQLSYALHSSDDLSDNAKLSNEIIDQIAALRSTVSTRDFTDLEGDTLELKSLVYKRDYTLESGGDLAGIQTALSDLDAQIAQLTAAAQQDTSSVRADRSGIFSGLVDGYEGLLTPEGLSAMGPEDLSALARRTVHPQEDAVGKLITSSRWYFICTLPEAQAKRLAEGWLVDVRFSRDWAGEVSMRVERLSTPENGEVVVVLSTARYLSNITLLRRQTVDIVFSSTTGIRVPKNALYQNEEQQWGVYVLVGSQAEFKAVTIVGEDDDFYLVQPLIPATELRPEQAKKVLRAGDEIIVYAEGLADGKIVRK